MPVRRRAWLTREGWYYVAVLAFIIGGAVLRSVNLLVVLAGTLIAPPLFNWRLVMASLMGLSVRRRLPTQIIAGEPLTVEIEVRNSRRWLSSWLIAVEDWIARELPQKNPSLKNEPVMQRLLGRLMAGEREQARALIAHVPAGGSAIGTYRITIFRRGMYRFGPLRVSTRFPLGLVRGQMTIPEHGELIVAPRLGRMLPAWASLLEAELAGDERRHPQRGLTEGDYYGLRPWQRGDSLRWVHWRTTAKLARPMVKQFERRRSRDVVVVLDPWHASGADEHLAELAISVTATAIYDLAGRGHARLILTIAGSEPQCFLGPASAPFCEELLQKLALLSCGSNHNLWRAIVSAVETAPPGCRVVVVSPRGPDAASLAGQVAELPLDPDDLSWIDVSGKQLQSLFLLP